jgi:HEAT repeat protein
MAALTGCGSRESAIRDLASDEPARQIAAAERLASKPDSEAVTALRRGLRATDLGVRVACARALVGSSDSAARSEAAATLTTAILEATSLSQAESLSNLLAQFGGIAFPEFVAVSTVVLDERLRAHLASRLKDALNSATTEDRERGSDVLINALQETDPRLFGAAYETLEWLAEPLVDVWVVKGLAHASVSVRRAVAVALSTTHDPIAVEGLIERLKDSDPLVRRDAARSLGAIADPAARNALKRVASQDIALDVREAARQALLRIP